MASDSHATGSPGATDIGAIVGRRAKASWSWDPRDVMLYALGVGAGQQDPARELELTTENSDGPALRAIPTFGALMTQEAGEMVVHDAEQAMIVHAEHALRLRGPIPLTGAVTVVAEVESVYDKGSGALVTNRAVAIDATTKQELLETRSGVFIRGAGGFGGERGPSSSWAVPERRPDHTFTAAVRPDQALLYRLSGDRNPLHSDPAFAARVGFERPILHGLATYGIAARLLFTRLCGSDPGRFKAIEVRFSAPLIPGDSLRVDAWDGEDAVLFQVRNGADEIVLDRGRLELGD